MVTKTLSIELARSTHNKVTTHTLLTHTHAHTQKPVYVTSVRVWRERETQPHYNRGVCVCVCVCVEVVCVSLHPGTVATDLSAPYHRGVPAGRLFSPQYSVERLLALIQTLSLEHTGGAYSWDGAPIPW